MGALAKNQTIAKFTVGEMVYVAEGREIRHKPISGCEVRTLTEKKLGREVKTHYLAYKVGDIYSPYKECEMHRELDDLLHRLKENIQ